MTRKVLIVGDPHLKIGSLKESEAFLERLLFMVKSNSYEKVIFLGDLFDTFAVIRSEIMALWSRFLSQSSQHSEIILIVGNHDMAGESGGAHALEPFKIYKNVVVIDKPHTLGGMVHFLPFYRNNEEFVKECQSLPQGSILFCHQSFNGAQFENGFYDPHGVDPTAVSHLAEVISGHIHRQQKIGNIWYPGTPFQMNFSDAGERKGVFEISLDTSRYNILGQVSLDLPEYFVIDVPTISKLKEMVDHILELPVHHSQMNIKLISSGGPAEIADFWKQDSVKALKSKAKRVVDALVQVKSQAFIESNSSKSKRERLHDFIQSRKWRSPASKLIDAAESILTQ
jgi:DNA repair exonuclease SbcCD nuclease subunit